MFATLSPGGRYRFRVIHSGSVYPFKISVDGHQLTVVASDSHDIEHVLADAVIVTPGERYDFEVNATRDVDNYWIRAESLEVRHPSLPFSLHLPLTFSLVDEWIRYSHRLALSLHVVHVHVSGCCICLVADSG